MKKTKDFSYAKTRQEKQSRKKWWIINGKKYSYYIWALPLIPFVILYDKISDYLYARRVWDEEKAIKVLDRVLPHVLEWVEEDEAYYYCMDWGYSNLWRIAPLTMRKWARKFSYNLHQFIKNGYQKDGYEKTIEGDRYETWIKFKKYE